MKQACLKILITLRKFRIKMKFLTKKKINKNKKKRL